MQRVTTDTGETCTAAQAGATRDVYAKVTWRIVPLLSLCYILAYLDRINIGFAQLQMKTDLGFTDAIYGLGAGIFFLGYFLFEVPSNILLMKVGARKTITRIMVVWGLISASMAFIHAPWTFYTLRFFLGAFEAGFFPGIILYLMFWYPGAYRGRVIAIFSSASAFAGVVGGPLSGWIMNDLTGAGGLAGWQWLFILEGIPTTLLGSFVFFYLDDHPRDATWLTTAEKTFISRNLEAERSRMAGGGGHSLASLRSVLGHPMLYLFALAWFCFICGVYMISFWLPTLIKELGVATSLQVGLLTAIPFGLATVGMILIAMHSDHTLERRWHCAIPAFLGAAGLVGLNYVGRNPVLAFGLLSLTSIGVFSTVPMLWSIPTAYLKGPAAAPAIALINSLGLLGGFVSPFTLGWIRTSTGSLAWGNWLIAGVLCLGALVILASIRPGMLREAKAQDAAALV